MNLYHWACTKTLFPREHRQSICITEIIDSLGFYGNWGVLEGGTENTPGIHGMLCAFSMLDLLFNYEENQARIFPYINNKSHILALLFICIDTGVSVLIRKDLQFFCDCI